MKAIRFTGAAMVCLLLGAAAPVLAQGDHRDRPQQQRNRHPSPRMQKQQRARHSAWQGHRARSWESDHRTWDQRGGYRGYRIPDTRFRRSFGPEHSFRVGRLPFRVVNRVPRFQYNGYWMSVVDPWPESWDENWYDNDDMYVSYVDNGYYLFNRSHPRFGLSLQISR